MSDIDERLRSIEVQLTAFETSLRSAQWWFGILVTTSTLLLGLIAWSQIDKIVEKNFDQLAEKLDEPAQRIQTQQSQVESACTAASISFQEQVTSLRFEIQRLVAMSRPTKEPVSSPVGGHGKDGPKVDPGISGSKPPNPPPDIPAAQPTNPPKADVKLFEDLWAKESYFLELGSELRLIVVEIDENQVSIRITDRDNMTVAETKLSAPAPPFPFSYKGRDYAVTLTRIGTAGFNRFTKAAFFDATLRTP